jgi:hypothetical protein
LDLEKNKYPKKNSNLKRFSFKNCSNLKLFRVENCLDLIIIHGGIRQDRANT